MKFKQFYSGSSGNLYTVTANNGKRLLIECGVPWAKLQKALGFDLSGFEGCLITHSHKDHCKALKEVRRSGIEIYATRGTFEANGVTGRRINTIRYKDLVRFNSFEVYVFETNHDVDEPCGFLVRADNEYLLFATDTSHLAQRFKVKPNIIAIECSFDKDILQERVDTGDINEALATRLLTSHMEKQTCINYLKKYCDLSKCEEIHLLHPSGDNIDKEQARIDFEKRFFIKTIVC